MGLRVKHDKATGRDYAYDTLYQSSPKQKKRRAARNKARSILEKEGKVHKGDGKEVDHKNFNAEDDRRSNLQVLSEHDNTAKKPPHLRKNKFRKK